ncbi:Regulator of chromosome condensation [Parasponia andersonii]|uniref:Regulator of chromosome condensation n=1 Tax=Parasponia andersonii TaxID=3476 RepID=A0A2P5A910_PARAD|nr:Regulator of chromosome condensation [Parasponia andersonii]
MNGNDGEGGEGYVKMEECKEAVVYMWGYLPGASPEKSPILSPVPVRLPDRISGGNSWKDVCGGGCGFAMAISGSGKLITWGSAEDEAQIYMTSGKHAETPEPFSLPTEASVVKAAAGWAHCVSVTGGPRSQGSNLTAGAVSHDSKKAGEEVVKRRKMTLAKQESESLISSDEFFTVSPSVITLGSGVRITTVAAGGRHTLALSGNPRCHGSWVSRSRFTG